LNYAWSLPGTQDAVVAVPVRMLRSQFHPYGDGQTNAVASFGDSWSAKAPPLVTTRITRTDGGTVVHLVFEGSLRIDSGAVQVITGSGTDKVTLRREGNRWAADWKGDASGSIWVRPQGWDDGFPVTFRHPVYAIHDLQSQLPDSASHLPSG